MTTVNQHIAAKLADPEFARAWRETEVGYQIARRLIAYRQAHGLTQRELARLAGVPQPVIARLESGRHTPALRTLERLAQRLGLALVVDLVPVEQG